MTWSGTLPVHPQYQDSYYAREDGAAESRHVFLDGNALGERFAQTQHRFSVAELGFGTGLNFLLTWQLWDRQRRPDTHLTYVSVEAQPLGADQMRQALSAWPELSARTDRLIAALPAPRAGFQHIHIDTDVTLLLLCADVSEALAQVQLRADAWFLDGFAPSRNPAMWAPVVLERVAALSAPGASFATYSAAGHVRRALTQAGFEVIKAPGFGRKRDMLRGRISTPPPTRAEPVWAQPPQPLPSASTLAVLGYGIVGACQARVLAERGHRVDVFGRADAASQRIPALLVRAWPEKPGEHGVSASQRYYQHAFEQARSLYARCCPQSWDEYDDCGVLHGHDAIRQLLDHPLIHHQPGMIDSAQHDGCRWQLRWGAGQGHYDQLLLCCGEVPAALRHAVVLPTQPVAGQVAHCNAASSKPRWRAIHALPLGAGTLLGSSYRPDSRDLTLQQHESLKLIEQAAACWPERGFSHARVLSAHSGVRISSPDHLPLLGPCPDLAWWQNHYAGLRHGPRHQDFVPPQYWPGLWLNLAHGSRGATGAALAALQLCSLLEGSPSPLENDLQAALHPGRFAIRRLRRGQTVWPTDANRATDRPAPCLRD